MITLSEIQATGLDIKDHKAIADVLSIGRTKVVPTPIGIGTILSVMAPVGGLFMGTLRDMSAVTPRTQDSANIFETVKMIEQGTFDVGHPITRVQLQAFASAVPEMASGISALLDVAVVHDPISISEIATVIERG